MNEQAFVGDHSGGYRDGMSSGRERLPDVVHRPLAHAVERRRRRKRANECCEQLRRTISLIGEATEAAEKDAQLLAMLVDQLVQYGLPPSSRQLREAILPIVDCLPELPDAPSGFRSVLRELGRFRVPDPRDGVVSVRPAPELQAAATLVAGHSIVLIGGTRHRESERALKDALRLQVLIWVESRAHESVSHFEPQIARSDVLVVGLLIRWSSHAFGAAIQSLCDKHDKLLIRVRGGYNVNQIATHIMSQCSDRLQTRQRARDSGAP